MKETTMNQEKLAKLQAQVRIGGKVRANIGWRAGAACSWWVWVGVPLALALCPFNDL